MFTKHSLMDSVNHMIANDITKIVLSKIHSKAVMYQFILEELDAAQHGNDEAVNFVKMSGIHFDEYNNALSNSYDEVDGPGGPQQTLSLAIMAEDWPMERKAKIRIQVVKNIINAYRACPF
ncbi:hypothetical protein J7552_02760 [Wohlfahrtiimonas chitiniclastica]|uniref:hypothetical protein n=1 Tax=Wohlfahrtiimonas chitiniclastica TaxID=400946 RepID=UPI001BCB0D20|nr:hypothetical protein [Wohlfahrtiimonas chitiniclastica]MBS7820199.1 hypothetical protein [Wohlfahrtiimonas chitiniclastica]